MDLRRQAQVVRAWLWLLIAGVLLAGGSAYLVSISLPKVYEAQVTLLVGESSSSSSVNYNDLLASQRISQTFADLATTGRILDPVIADAGLDTTTEEFRKLVTATAARDSTLVTVAVKDGDPGRAADLAAAIAEKMKAESDAVFGRNDGVQAFIAGQVEATQLQITDTQAEIDRLAGLPSRTTADEQQLTALKSQAASLRASYAALVGLAGSATNAITVVDPATPPTEPASPRVLLNTLLAMILGLLIALGIAFVMDYLDDTVKSSEDVEEVTGLPTLGTILKMRTEKGRSEIYQLATILYPRGPAAEAYRTLRTNLAFASVDAPIRTLLVTSSIPGEGKTTTSGNLAVAFAQAGRKVILLDADLRKPGINGLFVMQNSWGLTTLLASEEATIDDVAQLTEQENLRVITTGPLPPNPAELLGSQRMRSILERLAADADLVIVDSPPLQAVTDAAILASITDGTLMVIDSGRTRRAATQHGREALAKADARVLGVALNRMSARSGNEYVYYDYYGSKGKDAPAAAAGAAKACGGGRHHWRADRAATTTGHRCASWSMTTRAIRSRFSCPGSSPVAGMTCCIFTSAAPRRRKRRWSDIRRTHHRSAVEPIELGRPFSKQHSSGGCSKSGSWPNSGQPDHGLRSRCRDLCQRAPRCPGRRHSAPPVATTRRSCSGCRTSTQKRSTGIFVAGSRSSGISSRCGSSPSSAGCFGARRQW